MPSSDWTPSIVPNGDDRTVYLVKDDLGRLGAVWREADAEGDDLETVITDLLTGQYKDPVRVIAFNTVERWSQDVSDAVAHEMRRRGAAICKCEMFRQLYRTSFHGMKGITVNWRYGSSNGSFNSGPLAFPTVIAPNSISNLVTIPVAPEAHEQAHENDRYSGDDPSGDNDRIEHLSCLKTLSFRPITEHREQKVNPAMLVNSGLF